MKKFIAALLSAFVGVFGYTLTDSAVEERISKLETEIVELRREVSANNQLNGNVGSLEIGDFVKISSASLDKFLLRENEEGKLEFIRPDKIDQVKEDDVFVYLTDVTCQVVDFETVTHTIEKGRNYEPDTIDFKLPVFAVKCNGYTSSSLSGKQITFFPGFGYSTSVAEVKFLLKSSEPTSCLILPDGKFSFNDDDCFFDISTTLLNALADTIYGMYGKDNVEKALMNEFYNSYFVLGLSIFDVTIS